MQKVAATLLEFASLGTAAALRRSGCPSFVAPGGPLLAASALLLGGCIGVSAPPPHGTGAIIPKCTGPAVPAPDGLIDDFEDGNTRVAQIEGRGGYWFKSTDPAGSFFGPADLGPVEGGRNGGLVLHPVGKTVPPSDEAWGAILGGNFSSEGLYDASKYSGISFWAKVGENSTRSIRVEVGDVNTHENGGVCTQCWNHFGADLTFTPEWKQYVLLFRSLRQEQGWGDPRPPNIDPSQLYSIGFKIKPGNTFEFWLDDVEFVTCR